MIVLMTTFDAMAPLLAALPSLEPLYVVCLIVGGGLLVISTVFAGGNADVGVEGDVSVDVDADVDISPEAPGDAAVGPGHEITSGLSLASWFSIHFLVYFFAMFGLIGTVLSYLSDLGSTAALALALIGGIVAGQGAHQLLRYLRRSSGNSEASRRDFTNKLARVTVAIAPARKGEVAVQARGRERFVIAVGRRSDERFNVGDTVGIVAFNGGKAEVVSREEFEFITDS